MQFVSSSFENKKLLKSGIPNCLQDVVGPLSIPVTLKYLKNTDVLSWILTTTYALGTALQKWPVLLERSLQEEVPAMLTPLCILEAELARKSTNPFLNFVAHLQEIKFMLERAVCLQLHP